MRSDRSGVGARRAWTAFVMRRVFHRVMQLQWSLRGRRQQRGLRVFLRNLFLVSKRRKAAPSKRFRVLGAVL